MPIYEQRVCKTHGLTIFIGDKTNRYRCRLCKNNSVNTARKNLKIKAVEYKGGKCQICGYNKCLRALQFHHPDNNKEFGIAQKGNTRAWEKIKSEVDKCILLCANCHMEEHERILGCS